MKLILSLGLSVLLCKLRSELNNGSQLLNIYVSDSMLSLVALKSLKRYIHLIDEEVDSNLHMGKYLGSGSLTAKPELSPKVKTLARGLATSLNHPPGLHQRRHPCPSTLILTDFRKTLTYQPLNLILLQSSPTTEVKVILSK